MSCKTIRMYGNCKLSMNDLLFHLRKELPGEFVAKAEYSFADGKTALLVYEKYFFRNGSYANLTILLSEQDGKQTADLIGSGGGEGLFNFSWGANSNFAGTAAKILEKYGFTSQI